MGFLYNETQERERKALLIATTANSFILDRLWGLLSLAYPRWIGLSVEFRRLIGSRRRVLGVDGDVDMVAIPSKGEMPDFGRMVAIEVKTIPFSLLGDLKVWDKLDEAEEQAGKLARIGFRNVAVLHIINTENDASRDRGGSSAIWDASDRGLAAYDAIRKVAAGRTFKVPTFVLPWGAAPGRGEDMMGAGAVQLLGGLVPKDPNPEVDEALAKRLGQMINALPRPYPVGPFPPNVFSYCTRCAKIVQHFWDLSFCGCGSSATIAKPGVS